MFGWDLSTQMSCKLMLVFLRFFILCDKRLSLSTKSPTFEGLRLCLVGIDDLVGEHVKGIGRVSGPGVGSSGGGGGGGGGIGVGLFARHCLGKGRAEAVVCTECRVILGGVIVVGELSSVFTVPVTDSMVRVGEGIAGATEGVCAGVLVNEVIGLGWGSNEGWEFLSEVQRLGGVGGMWAQARFWVEWGVLEALLICKEGKLVLWKEWSFCFSWQFVDPSKVCNIDFLILLVPLDSGGKIFCFELCNSTILRSNDLGTS